jgi:hypothetical protein
MPPSFASSELTARPSFGYALNHHYEQDAAFVPPSEPAHSPAINVIAHLNGPEKAQVLCFNVHSPLRT